ncbi:hypothetical protein ACLOJK_020355 [Asimina triloba]
MGDPQCRIPELGNLRTSNITGLDPKPSANNPTRHEAMDFFMVKLFSFGAETLIVFAPTSLLPFRLKLSRHGQQETSKASAVSRWQSSRFKFLSFGQ